MKNDMTLYEKAVEKEKQIESLVCRLRDGESLMRHMHEGDDVSMCFDTTTQPYIMKAIKDLRHEIVISAIEHAKAELKEVRQAAIEEAKRVLADCQKEDPIPKVRKHESIEVNKIYCDKCGV